MVGYIKKINELFCSKLETSDSEVKSKMIYLLVLIKSLEETNINKEELAKLPFFNSYSCNNIIEELLGYVSESSRDEFLKEIYDLINSYDIELGNTGDMFSSVLNLMKPEKYQRMKNAEFFTPERIAELMAEILTLQVKEKEVEILDPCAGSGTLILALVNELKKAGISLKGVYAQEKTQWAAQLLSVNMMANGLEKEINHIKCGDTLINPGNETVNEVNDLKTFDFIICNPPFKSDFSEISNEFDLQWDDLPEHEGLTRFFAGIPNGDIATVAKNKISIYLCFLQHVIYSLKPDGNAAVIVPKGFLSSGSTIELKIKKKMIENEWLEGVISLPSKVFTSTETSAAILFIKKRKEQNSNEVLFFDASGFEIKKGNKVFNDEDFQLIKDSFKSRNETRLSRMVAKDEIVENDHNLLPSCYLKSEEHTSKNEIKKQIKNAKSKITRLKNKKEKLIGE